MNLSDNISLERYFQVQIDQIFKTLEEIKAIVKETRTSNELKTYHMEEKVNEQDDRQNKTNAEVNGRLTAIENKLKFAGIFVGGTWVVLLAIITQWALQRLGL